MRAECSIRWEEHFGGTQRFEAAASHQVYMDVGPELTNNLMWECSSMSGKGGTVHVSLITEANKDEKEKLESTEVKGGFLARFLCLPVTNDAGPTVSQARLSTLSQLSLQLCLSYGPPLLPH